MFENYKPMTEKYKERCDANDERGVFDWNLWWDEGLTWVGKLRWFLWGLKQ